VSPLPRWVAGALLGLLLAPALFVLHQAVAPGETAALARLARTVLPDSLGRTLFIAVTAAGLAGALGAGAAFLITFFDFPARRPLDTALVLPLVLPPYLVAIVYREMSHRHDWSPPVDSPLAVAVLLALTLYPYVYLLTRASFRRQAAAYIEVGKALGLDRLRIATRALLPLATPGMLLGALLVGVEAVSDFGTASVLGVHTLTTAVHRAWFSMYDGTLAAQLALIAAVVPLLAVAAYALATRGRGFETPTNRPRPPRRSPLTGPWRWAAAVFCALPVALGFAWPLLVLVRWAADAFGRFRLESLSGELLHTLALAGGTTAATLLLGLFLAFTVRPARGPAWSLGALGIVSLNYALPAIVLAISLLVLTGWSYETRLGGWAADSLLLVLLGTTLRFLAFAYFSAENGLLGVSRRVDEALRCVGRHRLHGTLRVLLPLIRGPLLVGGLLVFVITAKELTLSIVLQPFGYGSLALSVFHFADIDLYPPAALYALCLALVVLYPVLSLNRWLGGR
jgi:iron(III) transport system permease protein